MNWNDVGSWLKENAGTGTALIGSLLTGNVTGALAAGVSLVKSATGTDSPELALAELQGNPDAMIRLKELYFKEQDSIRKHIESMERIALESHKTTQQTIQNGDSQESKIRWVRPMQATASLIAGITYIFVADNPSEFAVGTLFALPFTYFGLREVGKGITAIKTKDNKKPNTIY